jgi:hypothetical protein
LFALASKRGHVASRKTTDRAHRSGALDRRGHRRGLRTSPMGPQSNCGISEKPLKHCYGIARHKAHWLGSIAAEDNEVAVVYNWQYEDAFYDQEQWVSWPNASYPQNIGWVEAGITEGNFLDCCTAYPFAATLTQKSEYHELLGQGPVASGSGQYNYDMIYDAEANGLYRVYWSAATNRPTGFRSPNTVVGGPLTLKNKKLASRSPQKSIPTMLAVKRSPGPTVANGTHGRVPRGSKILASASVPTENCLLLAISNGPQVITNVESEQDERL